MAFNKISLLSVEDTNVSTVNIQHIQNLAVTNSSNAQDIFYHLGTNLKQNSWSNPQSGPFLSVTTNTSFSSGGIVNITSRSGNSVQANSPSVPIIITFQFLTGFEVDLQAFRYIFSASNSFALDTFKWEGSVNGTDWEEIYSARRINEENGVSNTWFYEPVLDSRPGYYSYLRLHITELDSSGTFNLVELEIYGKLRNLSTGVAGFKTPGDRFDNLLNVDAFNPRTSREIIYDQAEGVWESRVNQPWTVKTLVMTEDLTLTRDDLRNPTLHVLSPNGSSRDVILPAAKINDAIKFRSLDGLFDINIYDQGNPTPVVLNNAGKLQYEYVYDGIEWHVIG